jgi:hypothetical protein
MRCHYIPDRLMNSLLFPWSYGVPILQEHWKRDAAVRESTTRPGGYKLGREVEARTVPGMSWACGGCRRFMRQGVDTPKRCAACGSVSYCGKGRGGYTRQTNSFDISLTQPLLSPRDNASLETPVGAKTRIDSLSLTLRSSSFVLPQVPHVPLNPHLPTPACGHPHLRSCGT